MVLLFFLKNTCGYSLEAPFSNHNICYFLDKLKNIYRDTLESCKLIIWGMTKKLVINQIKTHLCREKVAQSNQEIIKLI